MLHEDLRVEIRDHDGLSGCLERGPAVAGVGAFEVCRADDLPGMGGKHLVRLILPLEDMGASREKFHSGVIELLGCLHRNTDAVGDVFAVGYHQIGCKFSLQLRQQLRNSPPAGLSHYVTKNKEFHFLKLQALHYRAYSITLRSRTTMTLISPGYLSSFWIRPAISLARLVAPQSSISP